MASHVRINQSLLAAGEKRLLVWIAHRLPRWVHSDLLTGLAVAAMALTGAGFAVARWDNRALGLVVLGLWLNWFGDSLDGTLARVRRIERPRYGYYIDHALDLAVTGMLLAGMAMSGFMSPIVALALLGAYLMVMGEVFLATASGRSFNMSFAWFGPTELRIVLAIGALALFRDPHVTLADWGRFRLFDFAGVLTTAGLLGAFTMNVVRNGRALALVERPRHAGLARMDTRVGQLEGSPSR
jgi:phosphatidylglycerophosphate synthase